MSYQTSVGAFNRGKVGDAVGQQFYPTLAYNVASATGIQIGNFCWKLATDISQALSAKGTNLELAGVAKRSNTESWRNVDFGVENNLLIAQNQTVEVIDRGRVLVTLTAILGSGAVNPGDPVYVNDLDGTIVGAGGGTVPTGYTQTNFRFAEPASVNTEGAVVIITNVNRVEAS